MAKYSIRSIPAAAAMAAALVFGAQVHAQSTMPPAVNNTNKDITTPSPGTPPVPARAGTDATAAGSAGSMASTTSPGAGMAGARSSATTDSKVTGGTGDGGSTAIPGVMPKDADQRTANKSEKKSMKAAKRAARKSSTSTGASAGGSASATSADNLTTDTKK